MADGMAQLDAHIRRLRQMESFVPDAAPAVADEVKSELTRQIAAGVGPDGKALTPTKEGKRPLRNAAKALRVRAVGNVVLATLEGPEALHHQGRARGGVRRPILPSSKVPDPMVKAISNVLTKRFKTTMGVG